MFSNYIPQNTTIFCMTKLGINCCVKTEKIFWQKIEFLISYLASVNAPYFHYPLSHAHAQYYTNWALVVSKIRASIASLLKSPGSTMLIRRNSLKLFSVTAFWLLTNMCLKFLLEIVLSILRLAKHYFINKKCQNLAKSDFQRFLASFQKYLSILLFLFSHLSLIPMALWHNINLKNWT